MKNRYFKIYACCTLVKGAKRSIICDVQRNSYQLIPNNLYDMLREFPNKSVEEVQAHYHHEFDDTIEEYFDFLVQHEYAFWCNQDELELFPAIDLHWETPAIITNAIIDVDELSNHDFSEILNQLEDLGCKYFQLRAFDTRPLLYFETILAIVENRKIISTEFILKYTEETTEQNLQVLIDKFPRIHHFIVHTAPESRIAKIDATKMGNITYTNQLIHNNAHCGMIGIDYFSINIQTFTESQKYNTCLNRKVSIDVNGEIKNCPSMTKSYGHIHNTTLKQAIGKEGFKDSWVIHKDQIEICKDCEFRHICTDCRVYTEDPDNIYSKPAKCSYNPYEATWGEENSKPFYGK
jgi:SPASM domain peptide maturase of grasp-with-spasm system